MLVSLWHALSQWDSFRRDFDQFAGGEEFEGSLI